MRLFLHGRSKPSALLRKLEMARSSSTYSYTSMLLSNWNLDELPPDIVEVLQEYLSQQPVREIVLQNCTEENNDEDQSSRLENLVSVLVHACAREKQSSLTIRYDKQRMLPSSIVQGLLEGSKQVPPTQSLHALTLIGMTLTAETTLILQEALTYIPELQELTIRGNFTLQELDRRESSILGPQFTIDPDHKQDTECIVDLLHDMLQRLPDLKVLDLQQCHLPDMYLADLLEGLYPDTLQALRLNGNMCMEESQEMLSDLLQYEDCALEELDLSWQRLPKAGENYSVLRLHRLCNVLAGHNTSLKHLNVSDNRLLDQDMAELSVALSRNDSLKRLRLQNCRISTRGILALIHSMPIWSENLKSIHLDGKQRIEKSSSTRRKVFEALLENVYLQDFDLPGSCQSKRLDWLLALNRAGRRVLLNHNEMEDMDSSSSGSSCNEMDSMADAATLHDNLWPQILERADRVARQDYLMDVSAATKAASAVYLLLREKGFQALVR